jgi:uncharacterized membrane protein YphA (DoxX/SURF4 family)
MIGRLIGSLVASHVFFIRVFFVILLFASSIGKLLDMPGFYEVVATYKVFPSGVIPWTSWLLVTFELGLAAWLLLGGRTRFTARLDLAGLALIALHWVYFDWITIALVRNLEIPNCGCFGVFFARPLTVVTLVEDGLLLALAFMFWWGMRKQRHEIQAV